MTNQVALAATSAGTALPEISGAAAGTDTVPAGCTMLVRNTGAGTHLVTFTLGPAAAFDGMQATNVAGTLGVRQYSLTAGQVMAIRVPGSYGDANGHVTVGVDGTASEIKYYLVGR